MNKGCDKLGPYAPVFLRLALGLVFVYHGYGKVFGETAALGTAWAGENMATIVQVLVSWGELLAGVAFLLGFLTTWASWGIIVIMIGAIVTVHGANGFGMKNSGYEYNLVLICMCLALIGTGPGPLSIGGKCCCKKES